MMITVQVLHRDVKEARKTYPNYIPTVWKGNTDVCHESSLPESTLKYPSTPFIQNTLVTTSRETIQCSPGYCS